MDHKKLIEMLKNNDIIMAVGLVLVIAMMLIPLPPQLLDVLLILNITLSIIILLVCLYTTEPLKYSSFPTVLLVTTLFRLALNISSTRLILLHGSAGEVITDFGNFVIGGNYVVGAVIFIILVIINFMVITNGAGRVAEVTARFTLDAMPGKQLSIDADLNSGLINEAEAKEKRKKIERESSFYGTMDGASKFVKGDATAALIITAINIVGGLVIGMLQLKMGFAQAATTYTILTVGDGLVAQLPALIISTATGLLVTRASGREEALSKDIDDEMFGDPKILGIVSGLCFILGIIPGLPMQAFFVVSAIFGGMAYIKFKEKKEKDELIKKTKEVDLKASKKPAKGSRESVMELLSIEAMEVEIGYRLVPLLDIEQGGDLLERIAQIRRQTALDYGIVLPSIRVRDNLQLGPNTYQIKLKGIPIESGEVYPERYLAMNPGLGQDDPNLNGIKGIEPAFGLPVIWIDENSKEFAESVGYTVVSPSAVLSTHLTEVIKKNASEILTRADVKSLIDNVKKHSEHLVDDLLKESGVSISEIQTVLQNLLKERISIRDLQTILESISTHARINKNADYLTEQCRLSLCRSICKQNLSDSGDLMVVTLSPDIENVIAAGISNDGKTLSLDPNFTRLLIDNLNSEIERTLTNTGNQPVLLCSAPIRFAFRRLIERTLPQISVLSYTEVPPNIHAKALGMVRMNSIPSAL